MRIIFPSATIAAFSGVCLVSADKATEERATNDAYHTKTARSKVAQDVDKSYASSNINIRRRGDECDTFNDASSTSDTVSSSGNTERADVGVLSCVDADQACEADGTSSTGGRCTTTTTSSSSAKQFNERPQTPTIPVFPSRRHNPTAKQRFLQRNSTGLGAGADEDEPFVCPANCPQEFCDCASSDGDAEKCAPQLHSVCTDNLLSECVPDKYLQFYTDTYCPFAACLAVENKPYEECSCGYYKDYCKVYYAFEESIEKCATGTCCDAEAAGSKWTCLPGLQPTASPTEAPTVSSMPSGVPTTTAMPTVSSKPTSSAAPTFRPSTSVPPTVSSVPTPNPTDTPSSQPSTSVEPTTTPTKSPTLRPTTSPTASPTSSPSDLPSSNPTDVPSTSPTISSAPSTSVLPTLSPSSSMAPTISSAPTDVPSTSTAPTSPPSLLPTMTMPPTSSPSTTAPTMNPSVSPSKSPTGSPSDSPSNPPMTDIPTLSPTTEMPTIKSTGAPVLAPVEDLPEAGTRGTPPGSGGTVLRSGAVATLFVGVGGALWLFA
mmetsp:Transcript_12196/g.26558  ORF Transcript_12196/g.26558 Transcript_12196/m.26558 type:complete len:546 (+) Transcript_12196:81-1718(+)|eukprot:CAMPEP_0172313190 /NCGR_PEP_ID=MMETSP1058-20130122/19618_1 /TAXON_ID=83371 /ORGANISM="Detonula confervacea, Strain CCMP 353" /LENGTH=545 /DNA_ID=CAMNT_0013026803 /DNA_START=78 /DNA_END=1715 /DNA_ORIENTATION=+